MQRVRIACISKNLNLRIVLNFNFSQLELHHEFFFKMTDGIKAHEYRYTALLLGLNNDTVIIDKKLDIDLMTIYIHSPISNIHQWVNLVKRKVCINFTLKVRVTMDNNNKFSWSNFYNFFEWKTRISELTALDRITKQHRVIFLET